jgi:hypothetical protein
VAAHAGAGALPHHLAPAHHPAGQAGWQGWPLGRRRGAAGAAQSAPPASPLQHNTLRTSSACSPPPAPPGQRPGQGCRGFPAAAPPPCPINRPAKAAHLNRPPSRAELPSKTRHAHPQPPAPPPARPPEQGSVQGQAAIRDAHARHGAALVALLDEREGLQARGGKERVGRKWVVLCPC